MNLMFFVKSSAKNSGCHYGVTTLDDTTLNGPPPPPPLVAPLLEVQRFDFYFKYWWQISNWYGRGYKHDGHLSLHGVRRCVYRSGNWLPLWRPHGRSSVSSQGRNHGWKVKGDQGLGPNTGLGWVGQGLTSHSTLNTGALAPCARPKAGLGLDARRGRPLPLWWSGVSPSENFWKLRC